MHPFDEHVAARHHKAGSIGDDRRVVAAGPRGEELLDVFEQPELALTRDLHLVSIARNRRVACSGSLASPTARMTHARRIPMAVSCSTFDSSMPPIANTGTGARARTN